ncbi:uncharacterized protein LOC124817329 isoform X3 [Hydra vulgaris]|uniref:uncharacterized protein LOC124817329 isoform X3 n=1 Tax=Hydra vulgaris TaxID=6087 RepID=UPI0032E9D3BB
MSNNLRNEIIRLRQNERRQARRAEINRRRNERDEPRRDEINRCRMERDEPRRAEINRRRMERDEPRRAEINRCRIERDEPRRAEINCNQNERNQARRELNRYNMHRIARNNIAIESNYLGELNHNCQYCSAKKFLNETHFLCCHSGKVALAPLSLYPPLLTGLMTGNHVDHAVNQNFFKHIRSYNSSLSFASFTAEIAPPSNNGPFCFRVCGQILHRVGNLRPAEGCLPKYCQLYIYDPNAAVSFRMEQPGNDGCIYELMQLLQTLINQENPFALAFKNMAEVEDEEIRQAALEGRPTSVVRMSLLEGHDRRRYNLPSHEEVAIVFVGDDGAPPASREIVIYPRGQPLRTISSMSANLDPLVYPIFFPRGDAGWHNQLEHNPDRATRVRNLVTLSQYYNYRLAVRQTFSPIFYGKKLFQQYVVDAYVKVEGQRLAFIRNNQNKLRSEQYDALHEHVINRANDLNVRPGRVYLSLAAAASVTTAASSVTTAASSVTSKLFYSLILDLIYGLIGFVAFLTFFYLSLAAASSVTRKLFYSLILDLIYGLIGFVAFLIFFYLSLAAASSVTSSKSWEEFRKYRSQHPGPLSMRAFHRWCLYGDDHLSFRWRDGTPYNTGNRADAGRRRQRGAKVVNNFFTY